jgi:phosphatidylglycerol lysyltransferase
VVVADGRKARDAARRLVLRHGWNATAYQILNPGVQFWFSGRGDSVAGYAVHGERWIVAGAPVCAADRLKSVVDELEWSADSLGARVVFFGAGTRLARELKTDGHHALRIGAQPVWDAQQWPDIVHHKSSLRALFNRARNKGVVVSEWPATMAERHEALERVLSAWLSTRGLPPLHFMTETNTLGDLCDRRIFVAERAGAGVVGFIVATPVPARHGWLLEQWPRSPQAPNGTTALLVDAAMRAIATDGGHYVTMGLAPLSNCAGAIGNSEPFWIRFLLGWMRAHGRRFYNFRGLEAFKRRFEPASWEPIHVIVRGERVTPGDLHAIAGVFGGGSPAGLLARAIGGAAAREVGRLGAALKKAV